MPAYLIPLVVGLLGTGGFFWAVVNFRRDDTGKVIAQTAEVVTMLRALITDLERSLDRSETAHEATRVERDFWKAECGRIQVKLDDAVRRLRELGHPMPDA